MSGFRLVPVDGGEPIHLPPGETVIGRGPLLRVGDKRVSRHHGLLENLNGRLRLKPTHVNPCFIRSSLNDDPRPLQKDSWFSLQDGDLFSLLPGQLIYRVVAVGNDGSSRNGQRVEEQLPVSPAPDLEPLPAPPPCAQTLEEPTEAPPPQQAQKDERSTEVTPRRRVLPAWMMTEVTAKRGSSAFSPKDQRAAASRQAPTASAEEEEEEEEGRGEDQRPKKRRHMHEDEELREVPESSRAEVSEESDSFSLEADEEGRAEPQDRKPQDRKPQDRKPKLKKTESQSSSSASSKPSATPRTPCPYGKECYRKNPAHFQESSHPGDADYREEEESEEADRPECPYGTDCYRKNPLHRKEYKHTKRPAYNTRPRQKAAAADEDLDQDDSFINDESEDGGDDSDYAPPDSDDSGKEDIRRLQKEAQAFLKKRK